MKVLPGYPPDVIASHDVMVLENIRSKYVSAVIWVRPYSRALALAARELSVQKLGVLGFVPITAVADPGEVLTQFMASQEPKFSETDPVVQHIRQCATLFALFAPTRGAIRLDMIRARVLEDEFHLDGLVLRLHSTLNGPGLEWLPREHADYFAFERNRPEKICYDRRRIRQVPPQSIVIFKGWQYKGHLRRGRLNHESAMGWMHRGPLWGGRYPRVGVAFHSA
jgi:hypothetical protein